MQEASSSIVVEILMRFTYKLTGDKKSRNQSPALYGALKLELPVIGIVYTIQAS